MPRITTQEKYSIETIARPSRNSCIAYALRNYSQKDVLSVWRKPMLAYAVSVIIDGFGEFGKFRELGKGNARVL